MAKLTPEEFAKKHAKRLKASTEEMRAGARRVTVAPSASAIKAKAKMLQNLVASIEDGTWEKELGKITLTDWQDAFIDKGVNRVAAGIDGAEEKVKEFASWLNGRIDSGQAIIDKMPDLTLEDSIARSNAWIRHMAKEKYKGR